MVLSLVYKATPEHVRMIMIDPKMLELSVYEGIPHLLSPVVTDMKQAANALRWCVAEMERRYQLMSALGVRNIGGFNRKVKEAEEAGKPIKDPIRLQKIAQGVPGVVAEDVEDLTTLPFIVVIIDELADLMMIVGKKVEELIARLGAEGARLGHPFDPGDAAAVGGCDHRPHQGEHPDAHRVPGLGQGGFAHHSRPDAAPSRCWATATCCICRPARPFRRVFTARSSRTRKCIGWSPASRPPRAPTYIDEILDGPRNASSGLSVG